MNEFNQRQYRMMYQKIQDYQNKKISVRSLIDDLEGLLNILAPKEANFEDAFLSKWGILEDIYSEAVVCNQNSITQELQTKFNQAINDLENLIRGKIVEV